MTRTRTKAPALMAVPQNREQLAASIGRAGELRRQVEALRAGASDELKAIGEKLERDVAQPLAELAEVEKGIQVFCEANREELTRGRVKFAEFATGRILWRTRPPKVSLRNVEGVIDACKRLGLRQFLRVKEEVNKEAMLAEPGVARTIAGVSIGTEGEDFVIEPAEIPAPAAGR